MLIRFLFAAQVVLAANGADTPSQEKEPDPVSLLKTAAQARQQIASGEIEFDVLTHFSDRPLEGTNLVRLKVVFDGEKRRFEQSGREYSYVLMGPDAGAVTDTKRKELGLDKEAAVQAGLLAGFESHYVTAYDGARVLRYWSANRDTIIDDPSKGSISYAFDPRVLGLTPSPSVTDTIESCLGYGRAETFQLMGKESVEGVAVWHVRVLHPKAFVNFDFWIEVIHPSHVVKCEFNGNTVISRFDVAHPEDPIPVEVSCTNLYGRERARVDRTMLRRAARYNVPVDPVSWTIAGLDMPVGTEVVDYRISRRIGYWDGMGLSENLPPNRVPRIQEDRTPPEPAKLLVLAEKDSQSPFALEAATWIVLNTPDGPEVEKAADLIIREHLRSTNLVQLCEGMDRLRHRSAVPLLRAILQDNPHANVQAHACFALAALLKSHANAVADDQAANEAARLFERVVLEYGQAMSSEGRPLADRAKAELFELRRLGVGKLAPEIQGEDLQGRKMKLSDYRGKVVVLSFWGTWCGPCMAMVPDERKLVQQMTGKPFALLGVNSDHDEAKLKQALEKESITWPSFRDRSQGLISKAWNVQSWPTIYVLDDKGTIRYRDVRGQALFDAVKELIHETE
jgi:thiol-disulfide isomerase/thioredoxin